MADPYGKASYLTSVSPFANADDELKKLQEDIYLNKSGSREDPYKEITPLEKMRSG
jgi:hypothetical protein